MTDEETRRELQAQGRAMASEIVKLQEAISSMRDYQHAINLSLATGADKVGKQIKDLEWSLEQLQEERNRKPTRKEEEVDSIEFGTPGKLGCVKMYFDLTKCCQEDEGRVDAAVRLLNDLKTKIGGGQ